MKRIRDDPIIDEHTRILSGETGRSDITAMT
jgi:hypothetical protein